MVQSILSIMRLSTCSLELIKWSVIEVACREISNPTAQNSKTQKLGSKTNKSKQSGLSQKCRITVNSQRSGAQAADYLLFRPYIVFSSPKHKSGLLCRFLIPHSVRCQESWYFKISRVFFYSLYLILIFRALKFEN